MDQSETPITSLIIIIRARVNQHATVHQRAWMVHWEDSLLFSVPVPSQVDFCCLPFLRPDLSFFSGTKFKMSYSHLHLPAHLPIYLSTYLPLHLPTYQHFK